MVTDCLPVLLGDASNECATHLVVIAKTTVLQVGDGRAESGEDTIEADALAAAVALVVGETCLPKSFGFVDDVLLDDVHPSPAEEPMPPLVGVGQLKGYFDFGTELFEEHVGWALDECLATGKAVAKKNLILHDDNNLKNTFRPVLIGQSPSDQSRLSSCSSVNYDTKPMGSIVVFLS